MTFKSLICFALAATTAASCSNPSNSSAEEFVVNEQRVEAIEAGARRGQEDFQERIAGQEPSPTGSKADVKYVLNAFISVCPKAEDWFRMQEAVMTGDTSVNLPTQCEQLGPGTLVIAPEEGQRETVTHDGHEYEKGRLADGRAFWTDEMDKIVLSRR